MRRNNKLDSLEARYHFLGDAVAAGDRATLRAALYEVEEISTGRELTLKLWRKTGGQADEDLRELWRHEMRQIGSLMAHAGAQDVIVNIVGLAEDETFFGLVLDRVGRTLSDWRSQVAKGHWLRLLDAPRPRALFWKNIARVVTALGLIHGQGLVHGAVSQSNVISEGGDPPDFQLGGFEWSLVLAGGRDGQSPHAKVSASAAILRPPSYSFAEDWRCLGLLIAECLGVKTGSQALVGPDGRFKPDAILTVGERQLLKRLLTPSRGDQLEAHAIGEAIDELLIGLSRSAATRTGSLILAFERNSGLGSCVFEATDGLIATDEYAAHLTWVRNELDAGATLLVPRKFDPARHKLRLLTNRFICELKPVMREGVAAWDVAECSRIRLRGAAPFQRDEEDYQLTQSVVVARGPRDAEQLRQKLGPDALDWSAFATPSSPERDNEVAQVVDALFVAQLIEGVVKASEAYPVEILSRNRENGRLIVALRARPKSERDKIARKLDLTESDQALRRLFDEEERDSEVRWRLSRSGAMRASRAFDIGANFLRTSEIKGRHAYVFELDDELPDDIKTVFLRAVSDNGSEQVIARRLRILKAVESRADLAEMLINPWRARRRSGETLSADDRQSEGFKELDAPKQEALVAAFEVAPNFLVVGPPGVGKTRLATEVVTRKFGAEQASRVLISAQGHDALNHLQEKVQDSLGKAGLKDLLIVRSATPERQTSRPEEVQIRALVLLEQLERSSGFVDLPPPVRTRVRELVGGIRAFVNDKRSLQTNDRRGLGALANLLLEAADIVISTVNSPDVERLVEAREQFDWVIVEEAARATGPELTGVLLLSGRRLLIGDHNQLPAHDAERMLKILGNHSLVELALKQAGEWLQPMLDDDDERRLEALLAADPTVLRATAERASRLFAPFEALVEEDQNLARNRSGHRPIAATLTEQRRMHPVIAELVSDTFYKGELATSAARSEALKTDKPKLIHTEPLSASPIIVIDFPHVSAPRAGEPSGKEDGRKRFNADEVEAVFDVLRHIRAADGEAPTLAVLSPYRAQVEALQARIARGIKGPLSHLAAFRSIRADGSFVGTVDSFQGSEADVVILSLVRNNARVGYGAVGFLRDRRRMNVALSRAKDQLVIVGSLAFLKEAVRGVNPDGAVHKLDFLTDIVEAIDRQVSADSRGLVRKIRPSTLRTKS